MTDNFKKLKTISKQDVIDSIDMDLKDKERMLSIIKAVAHIGVDFGYGPYELDPEFIDMARAICEQQDI